MKKLIASLSIFILVLSFASISLLQADELRHCQDCQITFSKKEGKSKTEAKLGVEDIRNEHGNIPFLMENSGKPVLTLDGVDYELPFLLKDLLENDWQIAYVGNKSSTLAAGAADYLSLKKKDNMITLAILYPQTKAIKKADAWVYMISADDYGEGNQNLLFPGNLNFSSNLEDVHAAYGKPTHVNSTASFYHLSYGDIFGGFCDINISFDEQDKHLLSYRISLSEDILKNQNAGNRGKAKEQELNLATMPKELGDDLMSFNFMVEGDIYTLPASFQVFLNKGWEPEKDKLEEKIAPDKNAYITLHKKDQFLRLEAINTGFDDQALKDCVVFKVTASRDYDNEPRVNLVLPGEIDLFSDAEEITIAYGKPDKYSNLVGTTPHITYLKDPEESYGDRVELLFDAISGEVKSISLEVNSFHEISPFTGECSEENITSLAEAAKYNPEISKYSAPKNLSDKVEELNFKLEGELYQLPLPLAYFLENGWELMKQQGMMVKASQKYIYADQKIIRNNQIVKIKLSNPLPKAVPIEACLVSGVQIDMLSIPYAKIELPGGFTFDTTYVEFAEAYADAIDQERGKKGEFLVLKEFEEKRRGTLFFDKEEKLRSIILESN